jgi:hypothetical protein
MKKMILTAFVLLFTTTACAGGNNNYWVAPAIIGGIIGYGIARPYYYPPQQVYVQPAPVYVQPAPVYVQPAPVYVQPPQRCELRSEVINGQLVQGNFCY